ncbi:MAG: hypothetical protein MJA31_10340, partial [Clostridia bacterium]|nr:hypothetical protein [Clostridia bacterium]
MKKLFTLLALFMSILMVCAQVPNKINYQVVIRLNSGQLVTNQQIGIQISILQGSESGTAIYTERHTPTTNDFGLANLEIGSGTVINGEFSTINWGRDKYFLKTEIDPTGPGTNYDIVGINQLLAVPYAFHSKTAEIFTGTLTETDPVFELSVAKNISENDIIRWDNSDNTDAISLKEDAANKSTDGAFSANSDILFPTQKAVKSFIEGNKFLKITSPAGGITAADITRWNSNNNPSVADATTTTKGIVQLAGDLAGTATAPLIGDGKVTTAKIGDAAKKKKKILDGTIITADLADNAITSEKINNEAITAAKLHNMNASNDQFLKWNGTNWVPATIPGALNYLGAWDASSNNPSIADGTGTNGNYYVVSVAGTRDLGSGNISFSTGDWAIYNGSNWQIINNSSDVNSVFGRTGIITAQNGDYSWDQIDKTTSGIADIADVGTATTTSANVLIADGSLWQSKSITGDATLSSNGTISLANNAVTYAKIQNVSANKLLGRASTGAGVVEEINLTAAGRALLDDADSTAQRLTLGLGTAATKDVGISANNVVQL